MTLLGILWALLMLAGVILWSEPARFERMFQLVRLPMPALAIKPARRFTRSSTSWWFYPIIAPPGQHDPTQSSRSFPFRRI